MMVNSIKGANASQAWLNAISYIIDNGKKQGELSREILNLVSVVKNPSETFKEVDELFAKHVGVKWIGKGSDCIFPVASSTKITTHVKWSRNYWGRLTKYREKVNQLDFIIHRLGSKPHSKQLSCVTFDPEVDIQPNRPFNPTMPCLIAIDVKLRDEKLNLFAMFRSHDFGRKAYGNYIGLGKLLGMFSNETGYGIGEVVCYSVSAHIRPREFDRIVSLLKDCRECKSISPNKVELEKTLETHNLA